MMTGEGVMQPYLILAVLLFGVGLMGVLCRRHAVIVLLGIEFMLNAANINLVVFDRVHADGGGQLGSLFAMFTLGVAAAEAAVGLALVIAVYRLMRRCEVDTLTGLKG